MPIPRLAKLHQATTQLPKRHIRDMAKMRPEPLTIIFDDLDFSFTKQEIARATAIITAGGNARDIAADLARDEYEALLLGVWLWREGRV